MLNAPDLPVSNIIEQLNESRPLPIGRTEFLEWADRIIAGAMLTGGEEDPEVFKQSQVYCLANLLLHLGPTESHKPDAFFIHSLRKFAVNQVADVIRREIYDKRKAETELKERKAAQEADRLAAENDE